MEPNMTRDLILYDVVQDLIDIQDDWPSLPIERRRSVIKTFSKRVKQLEVESPHDPSIISHFGHNTYGREANIPAGVVMVGATYKEPQINIMLKGTCFVCTEHTIAIMEGPCVFVSEPNTKKVGYVIEDMQWITVMSRDNADNNPEDILKEHTTDIGG